MQKRHKYASAEPADYKPDTAIRAINGNVVRSTNSMQAWYRLSPQRWSFRSDNDRLDLIEEIASQYAEFQRRWLHVRVTSSPWPVSHWAKEHVDARRKELPDVPGALSFDDYMVGEQRHLMGRSMANKEVYIGVDIKPRTWFNNAVDRAAPVLSKFAPSLLDDEIRAVDTELVRIDDVMARSGFAATPCTPTDMRWLLLRSAAPGLPLAAHHRDLVVGDQPVTVADLATFDDIAHLSVAPRAGAVLVEGVGGPYHHTARYVAVQTMGMMQPLEIPRVDDPWIKRSDRLGIPVEWSGRVYVRSGAQVEAELRKQMDKVVSQVKHYRDDHGDEPPQSLARQHAQSMEIEEEMTSGFSDQSTRTRSWWRVAVSGESEEEAMHWARQLKELYQPRMILEHPKGQHALLKEFTPGAPMASQGHVRRGSVSWLAAGVPAATTKIGDRTGIILGGVGGGSQGRPVAWNPWRAQEVRDSSGVTLIAATMGSGKSYLMGQIIYKTLRWTAPYWTVLDPSGQFARLCALPELAPYSQKIELSRAQPGVLNPYSVVKTPSRAQCISDDDYYIRLRDAEAERIRLVTDLILGSLAPEIATAPATSIVLKRAVHQVGGGADHSLHDVIASLQSNIHGSDNEHAHNIAELIEYLRSEMPLVFPEPGSSGPAEVGASDALLTAISLDGLALPKQDAASRHTWTDSERRAVEYLNLAAWLTQSRVYGQDRHVRKGVAIDEAFFLRSSSTGQLLMNRLARDTRKWNTRVLMASQVPADFLGMGQLELDALVDGVFIGRCDTDAAASDALKLMGVTTGVGFERAVHDLRHSTPITDGVTPVVKEPRRWIFSDGDGGIEKISIDMSAPHLRHVCDALDTTPTGTSAAEQSSAPATQSAGV